jgi:hypothetical protein
VEEAIQKGGRKAHRYLKGVAPVRQDELELDGNICDEPGTIMQAKAQQWAKLRQRDKDIQTSTSKVLEGMRRNVLGRGAPKPFSVDEVTKAIKFMPELTGLGLDKVTPNMFKQMPTEAAAMFAGLVNSIFVQMVLPTSLQLHQVALLDKSPVDDRPITLMPLVYRLIMVCARSSIREWDIAMAGT